MNIAHMAEHGKRSVWAGLCNFYFATNEPTGSLANKTQNGWS